MIALIVAVNNKNTIGKDNKIPWYSQEDLKYFKDKTLNSTVIMGRKTFESLKKPLINRENIVITSSFIENENIKQFKDIKTALKNCNNENIFFIGGSKIYNECIDYCDKLYITKINNDILGDVFFNVNINSFKLINETYKHDEKANLDLNFQTYERK